MGEGSEIFGQGGQKWRGKGGKYLLKEN